MVRESSMAAFSSGSQGRDLGSDAMTGILPVAGRAALLERVPSGEY